MFVLIGWNDGDASRMTYDICHFLLDVPQGTKATGTTTNYFVDKISPRRFIQAGGFAETVAKISPRRFIQAGGFAETVAKISPRRFIQAGGFAETVVSNQALFSDINTIETVAKRRMNS